MGQPLTILGAFGKKVKGEYKNDMQVCFKVTLLPPCTD